MGQVLVVYATTEGQTAKVAQHIATVAGREGHDVQVRTAEEALDTPEPTLTAYDAVFVGGSLHEGHHQKSLRRFLKTHATALRSVPTGLFSLSLAAASQDPEERKGAEACMDALVQETGFEPTVRTAVAGALRYTEYSWLKRFLMKRISASAGGDTDTAQDFEYTDWDAVTSFAKDVLARAS